MPTRVLILAEHDGTKLKDISFELLGMANAIALAMAGGLTLSIPRTERLSMWRAGASANAARNGVFAALLAERGVTGPQAPFEALMRMAGSGEGGIELPPLGGRGRPFHTARTHMKASINSITVLGRKALRTSGRAIVIFAIPSSHFSNRMSV